MSQQHSNKSRRWHHLSKILTRSGPFVQAEFDPDKTGLANLKDMRILVVGSGGLGCEMLKCLALMGFIDIHVIDCDTIDLSNLNRQFLFRTKDIGRSKAVVAAEFINSRVAGCHVVAYDCRIEEKPVEFYLQFNIIVIGLDAVEPRKWLNNVIFSLLEPTMNDDENNGEDNNNNIPLMDNIIPMVDGGTEGFKGNVRVVIPTQETPCIECTIDLYPPRETFPMCTLAQRPRLPEHCIEYVRIVTWTNEQPFGEGVSLDGDDPAHLQWIYEKSIERGKEFGIEGISYRLTQGVVKHIIPAVASTNSVIASACVTEVFKLATASAPLLNNYLVFNDSDGIYTYSYAGERKSDCTVCGVLPIVLSINQSANQTITLGQLIRDTLCGEERKSYNFDPLSLSITATDDDGTKLLYMSAGHYEPLEPYKSNLLRTLTELGLKQNGQRILVVDSKQMTTFILRFIA